MTWLELDGQSVGQASLDPDGRMITDFEIAEPATLGIPTDWLRRATA